jgi:hypothetical protein
MALSNNQLLDYIIVMSIYLQSFVLFRRASSRWISWPASSNDIRSDGDSGGDRCLLDNVWRFNV